MASDGYKIKYEDLKSKYNDLVQLSEKGTTNYDKLNDSYNAVMNRNKELEIRLLEVESKLALFEDAIEPAINDYKELTTKLEIEQQCRTEAEIYASKIVKNNKKLKRESQMILQHLNKDFTLPSLEAITSNDAEEDEELSEKYRKLKKQFDQSQIELERLSAELNQSYKRINEYEKAIEPAIAEFEEINIQLEIEKKCKTEAEIFAQKMVKDNRKLKRQSQMLLQNLKPDFKINDIDILMEERDAENNEVAEKNIRNNEKQIAELNCKLSELSKNEKQLKDKLINVTSENSKLKEKFQINEKLEMQIKNAKSEIVALKEKLANENKIKEQLTNLAEKNATDESKCLVEGLQSKISDLEQWKQEAEKEIVDLKLKLESALAPPPPPPPPPLPPLPTLAPLLRFKKSMNPAKIGLNTDPSSPVNDQSVKLMEEMKNMMARIKKGGTIKEKPIVPNLKKRESDIPASLQFLHNLITSNKDDDLKSNRNSNISIIPPFKLQPVVSKKATSSNPSPDHPPKLNLISEIELNSRQTEIKSRKNVRNCEREINVDDKLDDKSTLTVSERRALFQRTDSKEPPKSAPSVKNKPKFFPQNSSTS